MNALQFKIRQRRSDQWRRKVLQLNLQHFSTHKSFDKMQAFIVTPHVQHLYKTWLDTVGAMFHLAPQEMPRARAVLAAYMIHGFPDDVVGKTRTPLEDDIITLGSRVVHLIHTHTHKDYHKVLRALATYNRRFQLWMHKDRFTQLEILAQTYLQARATKDAIVTKQHKDNPSPVDLTALDHYLATIRKQALKIAGKDGLAYLDTYKTTQKRRQTLLRTTVSHIVKKAFWDNLASQLSQHPPQWDAVVTILGEARDLLVSIAPNDAPAIQDALDLDLLQQMITRHAFNLKKIVDLVVYLVDQIKAYGPPAQDEHVTAWRATVLATLAQDTPTDMAQFIPKTLAQVLERLTAIAKAKALVEGLAQLRATGKR